MTNEDQSGRHEPLPGGPGGKTLGDFRLVREIGRGGMGVVYEAEQVSLHRKVALKVLYAHLSLSRVAVMKFRREAMAGGKQSHPGIVSIYAVGEDEGIHYIAQEIVEGGRSLADQIEELRKGEDQPVGFFREAARLIAEAADALQHAHDAGVIHRDVKPSNILLTSEESPKVADFGLARIEDALVLSRTGELAGTPYYMSPEQVAARGTGIDHRTDIYSLGVTLYELLTLSRPFEGKTSQEVMRKVLFSEPGDPRKKNPRIPQDLAVICLKVMEKKASSRYARMSDFAEDLRRFLNGEMILAKPVGFGAKLLNRARRKPVLSAAVGVALVAIAALIILMPLYLVRIKMEENRAQENKVLAEDRLSKIMQLSDAKRLSDLEKEAESLWPANPKNIRKMESWLKRADTLVANKNAHIQTLRQRRMGIPFDEKADSIGQRFMFEMTGEQWHNFMIEKLIGDLETLMNEKTGTMQSVRKRFDFASTVEAESIKKHEEEWDRAITSIADRMECPEYNEYNLVPQIGLVPLGRNPDSGFWEFAHLQTGSIPERGSDDRILYKEECGLVFVLIPRGTFDMGARRPDANHPEGSPNVDPAAKDFAGPVHPRKIKKPFFLSKYEMTQGQWLRFTGGNPSVHGPETVLGGEDYSLLHPVEQVDWDECCRVVDRLGLRLPSEAEWEYAARAGTSTVWWTGNDMESLIGAANLKEEPEGWEDGYEIHAPVHFFRANPYGLHNMIGNVREWCQDTIKEGKGILRGYEGAPVDGSAWVEGGWLNSRVTRGGSWFCKVEWPLCRSGGRSFDTRTHRVGDTGLRPVRPIDD